MGSTKRDSEDRAVPERERRSSKSYPGSTAFVLGITIVIAAIGYALLSGHGLSTRLFSRSSKPVQTNSPPSDSPSSNFRPETHLTQEAIDLLLNALDQAIRQKDVEGVLQHIAPDATITVHIRQGSQKQIALLTREEYRRTLAMGFAFPSANDFARVNTSVSFASDGLSAKVSFKSRETLLQADREIPVEEKGTLVLDFREDKPTIISLEKYVQGDST